MKFTVVTACLNRCDTIEACVQSVLRQQHVEVEHIVVDGASTDGTLEVLERYREQLPKTVSGPDSGIYDAFNRGLALAEGDVVGFLGADDELAHDHVLEHVAAAMAEHDADLCHGDLVYVRPDNADHVVRYWRSRPFTPNALLWGWMTAHPATYIRRGVLQELGGFNADFRIAADYELMLRCFSSAKVTPCHLPEVLARMGVGGISNRGLANLLRKSFEDYRAWRLNRLGVFAGLFALAMKNISKLPQFFR